MTKTNIYSFLHFFTSSLIFFLLLLDRVHKSSSSHHFTILFLPSLSLVFFFVYEKVFRLWNFRSENTKMMKMTIGTTAAGDGEWELRPGGMVVQRRTDDSSNVPHDIRVRVKYGSVHHEISINSQSTFGNKKRTFFQIIIIIRNHYYYH